MCPVIWSQMRTQVTVLLVRQNYETIWCQIKQLTFFTPNSLSITRFRISSTFLLEAAIVVSSSSSPPSLASSYRHRHLLFLLWRVVNHVWAHFRPRLVRSVTAAILYRNTISESSDSLAPWAAHHLSADSADWASISFSSIHHISQHWDTFPSPDYRSHDHSAILYATCSLPLGGVGTISCLPSPPAHLIPNLLSIL